MKPCHGYLQSAVRNIISLDPLLNLKLMADVMANHWRPEDMTTRIYYLDDINSEEEVLSTINDDLGFSKSEAAIESLLDSSPMDSACSRCSSICGQNLYNVTNWDLFRGDFVRDQTYRNRLKIDSSDGMKIRSYLYSRDFNACTMMHEMFALSTCNNDGSGSDWAEQNWICIDCIVTFVEQHIQAWWIGIKQKYESLGKPIPEAREF